MMNWLCATLMICAFSPLDTMTYENNDEFIEQTRTCAIWHNTEVPPQHRVPWQLAVAQAIQESNYGKSYFATEANNIMGIKEFDDTRDGLKPRENPNVKWSMKIFDTKCQSVIFYMGLLNTNHNYEEFRLEQLKQWTADYVDLEKLAKSVAIYAEDVYYTKKIIQILRELKNYE
jgi:uncharacterized FlgJ-related protein